jgi:hypothetical protein
MNHADRYRRLGTYRTPRMKVGAVLSCEARDCDVMVTGYSDGRISWPVGKQREGRGPVSLIVFGALVDAVRRESNQALAYWFGVWPHAVSRWRKALGVAPNNAGTHRLRTEYGKEDWFAEARRKAATTPWMDERRRKLSTRFKGVPRPRHVMRALQAGRRGKPHPPEVRARLSALAKARGIRPPTAGPPWTERENELVRTLPPAEVARRTGRTLQAVYDQRSRLGVPDGRASNGRRPRSP